MLASLLVFQIALLLGSKIGNVLIIHLGLVKYVLRPKTSDRISVGTLQSSEGRLKDFVQYSKLTPEIAVEHRLYFLRACWNLALSIILGWIWYFLIFHTSRDISLVLILGYINCYVAFIKLVRVWRRYRFSPAQILLHDTRKPVLYLRSFYHDPADPGIEIEDTGTEINPTRKLSMKKSLEERLVTVLRDVGPVVAVGRPNEAIPQLGAIKFYFSDEEWQDKVQELMSLSQLVVIQAGYSHGTEWEMATAKERLQPEQLIFSFIHWQGQKASARQLDYDIFKMQVKRIYGFNLPEKVGRTLLMYFSNDWIPLFARIRGWKGYILGAASTTVISETLRELFKKSSNQPTAALVTRAKLDLTVGIPALTYLLAIIVVMVISYYKLGPFPFSGWKEFRPEKSELVVEMPCSHPVPNDVLISTTPWIKANQYICSYRNLGVTITTSDQLSGELQSTNPDKMLLRAMEKLKSQDGVSNLKSEISPFKDGLLLTATYRELGSKLRSIKVLIFSRKREVISIVIGSDKDDAEAEAAAIKILNSVSFRPAT